MLVTGVWGRSTRQTESRPSRSHRRSLNCSASVTASQTTSYATHLPGEDPAVTVHGRAAPVDVGSADHAGFRQTLLDVYVPRYGPEWEAFLDSGPVYARIDADRMFTFHTNQATTSAPGVS